MPCWRLGCGACWWSRPLLTPPAPRSDHSHSAQDNTDDDQYVAIAFSPRTRRGGYDTAVTAEAARTIALNECTSATGDHLCVIDRRNCALRMRTRGYGGSTFVGGKGPDPDSARAAARAKLPSAINIVEPSLLDTEI